jgi:hypothetical protein
VSNNQKIIDAIDQAIKSKSEKTFLDFKVQWHQKEDRSSLIHDILALSNCDYKDDRYLVIGVEDETFDIKGVVADKNRKNTADLTSLMYDSRFNKIPNVEVREIDYQNSVLDVVIIKYDANHNRPFYIEKLTDSLQKKLSAGAIYSRNNNTNTPKNSTANNFEIEKMWREHFGIDKSALERFKIYLEKPDDWEDCEGGYCYKYFPEFRVVKNYDWESKSSFLKADWRMSADHTPLATMHEVGLQCHSTILYKNKSAEIDNHHTSIMHPDHTFFDKKGDQNHLAKYLFFFVFEDCLLYRMSKFLIAKNGCERPNGVFCYDISEFNPNGRFIFVLKGDYKENYQNIRTTARALSKNSEKMKMIKNDARFHFR